jgi:hypothetical protein
VKEVARLLNELKRERIIVDYAVFGATAQMRYTEPVATLDADVLVSLKDAQTLEPLRGIYQYTESKGLLAHAEAIMVGRWPVQFIPVFDTLTDEAVRNADEDRIDGEPIRVVTAVYLAVIALKTARAKDHLRIVSLLEAEALTPDEIMRLAAKHGLSDHWKRFRARYLDE